MGIGNRLHLFFLDVFILLFISEIHMYVFHGELFFLLDLITFFV